MTSTWSKGILRALPIWLGLALCLLSPALAAASQWKAAHDTVDSNPGAGQYVSLAVGGDGKLHMVYLRGTGGAYGSYYSTGTPGSNWPLPTTLSSTTNGLLAGTSIDLDASSLPHVAYYVAGNASSRNFYTKYKISATTWSGAISLDNTFTPTQDSTTSLFMYKGGAHTSYYKSNALAFANYSRSVKTLKTVDSTTAGTGKYSGTVVDSQGTIHVLYYDATGNALMYAYASKVSGTWTKGTVAGVPTNAGGYCALAIDGNDRLHASYLDATDFPGNVRVKYITKPNNGSWSAPVDLGQAWATSTPVPKAGLISISVDNSGYVHVSYYGASKDLRYATNLGGSWGTETVPADVGGSADYGMYSSVKVDANHNVYIAYYDAANQQLKVACKQIPGISITPASLSFGSVSRNASAPPQQTVTINNNGTANLDITRVQFTGSAEFSAVPQQNCSPVAPGGRCTVTVTAAPTSGGVKNATLEIDSSDPYRAASTVAVSAASPWQIAAGVGYGGNGGTISPSGVVEVPLGGSQSFAITSAAAPFSLSDVVVDGNSQGAVTSYQFQNVDADHSIQSLFVSPTRLFGTPYHYFASLQEAYNAILDPNTNTGSGTIQSQSTAPAGETLTFSDPVTSTIRGGYDGGWTQTGTTSLRAITVSNGELTPEGLVLE